MQCWMLYDANWLVIWTMFWKIWAHLVSHPGVARFADYCGSAASPVDFLHSLDDLPDRARLAVADLNLPTLELTNTRRGIQPYGRQRHSRFCQRDDGNFAHNG